MADRPLRVLLVVGETAGGIGRHVELVASRLGRTGIAAAVCGPASALAVVGEPAGVGRELLDIAVTSPLGYLAARRRMRRLARGFDLVHAHGLQAGAVAAGRPAGVPLVVTWHNAPLVTGARRRAHDVLSRRVARAADLILGASPDLTELALAAGARQARTTFVVAPPLPPASRSRAELRAELGVGDAPLILAVGRLQAQKRFDVLVDAAARWADRADPPRVVIAGDGPDADALRAQIERRGAPVTLLGARTDVADLLGAADVVALPSAWEARSLVAQEALRSGVPLVTTPVGGLPDLVGDAGVFVPVGDAEALAAALQRVLDDPELRRDLAAAGLVRAADWPGPDTAVAELADVYRALTG